MSRDDSGLLEFLLLKAHCLHFHKSVLKIKTCVFYTLQQLQHPLERTTVNRVKKKEIMTGKCWAVREYPYIIDPAPLT